MARLVEHSTTARMTLSGKPNRITSRTTTMAIYAAPGAAGAKIAYKSRYDNFIGGKWVAPVKGQYFDVITPISGKVYTQAARSTAEDIELALDAAARRR